MPAVRRYDVSPYVEFGVFQLSDALQVGAPLGERDRLGPDDLLVGTGGGVLFRSAGTNFHATVGLELWDTEPPADGGRWDGVQESDFDTPDGALQFRSTMATPFGDEIPLPGGPGTYLVRAHRRGAEQWLVQIWPVDG